LFTRLTTLASVDILVYMLQQLDQIGQATDTIFFNAIGSCNMKTARLQMRLFACLLLVGTTIIAVGFTLPNANRDFGKTLNATQMASTLGGGFTCPDKDCDTTVTGCPGGDTCDGYDDLTMCWNCKSDNGEQCGQWQQSWGWMCVQTTADCNDVKGSCAAGSCEMYMNDPTDDDSCGTRPDC